MPRIPRIPRIVWHPGGPSNEILFRVRVIRGQVFYRLSFLKAFVAVPGLLLLLPAPNLPAPERLSIAWTMKNASRARTRRDGQQVQK